MLHVSPKIVFDQNFIFADYIIDYVSSKVKTQSIMASLNMKDQASNESLPLLMPCIC